MSDLVIFTMDDPRYESVEKIIDEMVSTTTLKNYVRIIDREQAIIYALKNAKKEDIMKDMKKEAEKRVAYRYLLEAIVKAEEITISDKDAKDEVKKMADMYKMTEEDIMKELGSLEVVKYDLAMQKAIELLKENN